MWGGCLLLRREPISEYIGSHESWQDKRSCGAHGPTLLRRGRIFCGETGYGRWLLVINPPPRRAVPVSAVAAETPADAPEPLELPTDRPRSAQPDHAWALVRMEVDEELVASLRALGLRRGARISSVLLAGGPRWLSRLSGHTDLVIGTSSREVEGLIGFGFQGAEHFAAHVVDVLLRDRAGGVAPHDDLAVGWRPEARKHYPASEESPVGAGPGVVVTSLIVDEPREQLAPGDLRFQRLCGEPLDACGKVAGPLGSSQRLMYRDPDIPSRARRRAAAAAAVAEFVSE